MPEDEALARSGEYAAVLGGHDHFVHNVRVTATNGRSVPVVKAGADAKLAIVVEMSWSTDAPPHSPPTEVSTRSLPHRTSP